MKKTVKYSKMLPDWTVSEFFTELENLFNIAFVIDEYTKKYPFGSKTTSTKTHQKYSSVKFRTNLYKPLTKENILSCKRANTGYELTDDIYFKFQKLDRMIIDRAKAMTFPSYEDIRRYKNEIDGRVVPSRLANVLFYSQASGTQYAAMTHSVGRRYAQLDKVNLFKNIINNPDKTDPDISLKIIPAPIRPIEVPVYKNSRYVANDGVLYNMLVPLPVTETDEGEDINFVTAGYTEKELDIESVIADDSGAGADSNAPDRLFIFFYTGRHDIFSQIDVSGRGFTKVQYPVGFVDYLYEDECHSERVINEDRLTLRLDSDHGLKPLYDSLPVDTVREYAFKFVCRKNLDAKAIFVFNNKNFVCKQLKYTVRPEGTGPPVEGVFYPVD